VNECELHDFSAVMFRKVEGKDALAGGVYKNCSAMLGRRFQYVHTHTHTHTHTVWASEKESDGHE
jgi:hypothetical protein